MTAQFCVVMPVQAPSDSLLRSGLPLKTRSELALAFAADTVETVQKCRWVSQLIVVSPDPTVPEVAAAAGAGFVASRSGSSVNEAVDGALRVTPAGPAQMVAAIVSDLPALEGSELDSGLAESIRHGRSVFAMDLGGTGITFQAEPAPKFVPCLEGDLVSELMGRAQEVGRLAPGIRCDLDTTESLKIATFHGLGPRTRTALGHLDDHVFRSAAVA